MLTKPRYSPMDMLLWTRWDIVRFTAFAAAVVTLYDLLGMHFLHVPWAPVAVVGTAVAFIVGFQNNAAYGRIWEARKIWGGIVNASRTFGMKVCDMVTNEHAEEPASEAELARIKRILILRHIAWLATLRHAMRSSKSWEEFDKHRTNREWSEGMHIPERVYTLEQELPTCLPEAERDEIQSKRNQAAAVLFLQSQHLRALKERGLIWEFAFLELENVLQELFALQGKSERIKNFPYPRQYATLSYEFVLIFIALLPFAVIPEFAASGARLTGSWPTLGPRFVWLAVPFCVLISWVFHTMERIGRVGENPFEGSANDVPISTISRGIEIDLKQLLGDGPDQLPEPLPELYNVQM